MDNPYREGYLKGMEDAFKMAKDEIGKHVHAMRCGVVESSLESQYWKKWGQEFYDKFDAALAAIKEGE